VPRSVLTLSMQQGILNALNETLKPTAVFFVFVILRHPRSLRDGVRCDKVG